MHETCTKTQCNPHRILWVLWPLIKPINQANVMTHLLSNSHSRYDVRLRHKNLTQFKTNIIVQTISDKHQSPTNPSLQNCLSRNQKNNTSLSKGITPIIFCHCFQPTSAIPIHVSKKNQRMAPQICGDLLLLLPTVPKAMKSFNLPVSLARAEKLSK